MSQPRLSEKFIALSPREQILILISALVIVIMVPFNLVIDGNLSSAKKLNTEVNELVSKNRNTQTSINEFKLALANDPNAAIKQQIEQYKQRLAEVDEQLLALTDELINPIQMREALMKFLLLQKGVSLLSFEVLPAEAIVFAETSPESGPEQSTPQAAKEQLVLNDDESESLTLYRHAVKIKLKGRYFQLRDYLKQLESLPWKFYWHDFHYKLTAYPNSELAIEIYSLSTNQEFIGV